MNEFNISAAEALSLLQTAPEQSGIVYVPFEVRNVAVAILKKVVACELVPANQITNMIGK